MLNTLAFAGGDKGNGGGVHTCSDGSVEMYDLFEGRVRYGFKPVSNLETKEAYIDRALAKIHNTDPGFEWKVREQLAYLNTHVRLSDEVVLTPVGDANILLIGKGCSYQQLANWDEVTGNIFVEQKLFEKMTPRNVAAFYIHEAIYKVLRELRISKTSDLARQIVADVFDQSPVMLSPEKILSYGKYSYFSNLKISKDPKPSDAQIEFAQSEIDYVKRIVVKIKKHFGDESFYSLSKEDRISFKVVMTVSSSSAQDKIEALKNERARELDRCSHKVFGKDRCIQGVSDRYDSRITEISTVIRYLKETQISFNEGLYRTQNFYFGIPEDISIDLKVQVYFKGEVIQETLEKGIENTSVNYELEVTENERAVR